MILFVFEGSKDEPKVYDTIKSLYLKTSEDVIYVFNSNIYGLYNKIKSEYSDFKDIADSADVVALLRKMHPESDLKNVSESSQIDQIFLFFDYDFQHAFHVRKQHPELEIDEIINDDNNRLEELLDFFCEETEMGKLYINYPMIEALKYTKTLPDKQFFSYTVTLDDCHGKFKGMAEAFTDYHGYYGLLQTPKIAEDTLMSNWEMLKEQNVIKANYICAGEKSMPKSKSDIAQSRIFGKQRTQYVDSANIYVLSAFPIFLYEYFK